MLDLLTIAAQARSSVGCTDDAIEGLVTLQIRNERARSDIDREVLVSAGRARLHRWRLVRSVVIRLREQLAIDGVDRTVEIEVGGRIEPCGTRGSAERSVEQLSVETVDLAVTIHIARHEDRQAIRAARGRIRASDGQFQQRRAVHSV